MEKEFERLEDLFHQPTRLAIMTELLNSTGGLSFNELKERCDLTDGNLSRHLRALEEAKAVSIRKSFVGAKPHTLAVATKEGRAGFMRYLDALEEVLKRAARVRKGVQDVRAVLNGAIKPAKS